VKVSRGLAIVLALLPGCGPDSLTPSSVDPGQDFSIADVVYDANYYYCKVEPMLFAQKCGPGDSGQGDSNGGCHFNVTSFRLTDYSPLIGDSCNGTNSPGVAIPPQAQTNYASAQSMMQLDPNQAPLLIRPTGKAAHPRKIFAADSPEAQIIKDWATKFSTQ
jgi:hypothetical protein